MELFADKVSFNHEIDHNPKPEDVGRIKVYGSILFSEDPITVCPTVLAFSLPARDFLDNLMRYRWEQLECLVDDEGLNLFQVEYAMMELDRLVLDVMFNYSDNYSTDCDLLIVHITFKFIPSTTVEIFEEDIQMQVPYDESTIDIRFRPASKFAVESLSRKVYKKTTSSSDMCTICFDEFKVGEKVVTLSCGHEFDDSCIIEWFATNHICPLCRFQLPCES